MKARIVERTHQDGSKKYWIQNRFVGIWFDHMEFDSPARRGKSILVEGDFAQKVLALNGLPN